MKEKKHLEQAKLTFIEQYFSISSQNEKVEKLLLNNKQLKWNHKITSVCRYWLGTHINGPNDWGLL